MRERNARGGTSTQATHSIIWGGGGFKYAKLFVRITIKAEVLFTLWISNALGRSLGHTWSHPNDAAVFHPLALRKIMFIHKFNVAKSFLKVKWLQIQ